MTTPADTEQDTLILDSLGRFLDREVKPHVHALEHDDIYPADIVEGMKALGLFGATIGADYGGLGLSATTYAKIVERVASVWMSLAGIFNSHLIMAAAVERFGTPQQKAIRRASPTSLAAMSFAAGSMGPKVEAACRFALGRWSRRASSSVCRSTSRVQLMTTLAGQTTRKCVAPLAARWHIAASDCIVLPRPISSPRTTRSWTRANFVPKA